MSFEPTYKYYSKEELYKLCEFDDEECTAFRKRLVDAIFGSREIADKYREAFIAERIAPIVKEMRELPRHEIALMAISNSPYCDVEEILDAKSAHDDNYVEPKESDIADPEDYLGKARILYERQGDPSGAEEWRLYYLSEKRFTAFYDYCDPWEDPEEHDSAFCGSMEVENDEEYQKLLGYFLTACIPEKAIHGEDATQECFKAAVLSETRFDGRTTAAEALFKDMLDVKFMIYPRQGDGEGNDMLQALFDFARNAFAPVEE